MWKRERSRFPMLTLEGKRSAAVFLVVWGHCGTVYRPCGGLENAKSVPTPEDGKRGMVEHMICRYKTIIGRGRV